MTRRGKQRNGGSARHKINIACTAGAAFVAAFIGAITDSAVMFFLVLSVMIVAAVQLGGIRE